MDDEMQVHQSLEDVVAESAYAIPGDIDSTTSMTGFLPQEGQFLHVEGIAPEESGIYLSSDTREPIAYLVNHHEESPSAGGQESIAEETVSEGVQPGEIQEPPFRIVQGHKRLLLSSAKTSKKPVSLLQALNCPPKSNVDESQRQIYSPRNQSFNTVTLVGNPGSSSDCNISYILLVTNPDDNQAMNMSDCNLISLGDNTELVTSQMDDKTVVIKTISNLDSGSEIVTCENCNYSTNKRYLLAKHMKIHSTERPHKCSFCGNSFKTCASLTNHVNAHSGVRPHKCKQCDSAFTTSGELIRHMRYKHTFEKPHRCTECDYASVELSKLKRHMRTHTGERPYQCDQCNYKSPDSYKLKRHMRIHTGEKPYVCDICSARFTQSTSLKAHRLIHTGNKPVFHCHLCPATCGRRTDLRVHLQNLHSKEKEPIICRKCHRTFQDRYNYKLHMKCHDGERSFKCNMCEFATLNERRLEDHLMLQHDDYKPYKCSEEKCDLAFRYKALLKRHKILSHSTPDYIPKEKKYSCSCGKSFVMQSNQAKHQEIHSGIAPLAPLSSLMKDIEDIDEIGEEIVVELAGEISKYNPIRSLPLQLNSEAPTVSTNYEKSIPEDNSLESDTSLNQDSTVEILYNIAPDVHAHDTDEPSRDIEALSPEENIVTLEIEELTDSVVPVQEVSDNHISYEEDDQATFQHISLHPDRLINMRKGSVGEQLQMLSHDESGVRSQEFD